MGLETVASLSTFFQDLVQNPFRNGHWCSWSWPLPSWIHFLILTQTQIMLSMLYLRATHLKKDLCVVLVLTSIRWMPIQGNSGLQCWPLTQGTVPVPEEQRPECQMSITVSAYIKHFSNSDNFLIFLSYLHRIKRANVWVRPLAQRSLHVGYGHWDRTQNLRRWVMQSHWTSLKSKDHIFYYSSALCKRTCTDGLIE